MLHSLNVRHLDVDSSEQRSSATRISLPRFLDLGGELRQGLTSLLTELILERINARLLDHLCISLLIWLMCNKELPYCA